MKYIAMFLLGFLYGMIFGFNFDNYIISTKPFNNFKHQYSLKPIKNNVFLESKYDSLTNQPYLRIKYQSKLSIRSIITDDLYVYKVNLVQDSIVPYIEFKSVVCNDSLTTVPEITCNFNQIR